MSTYTTHGAYAHAVNSLGSRIVGGELGPGSALDVTEVGDSFGVSRTVVREAIRVLDAKGLVGAKPRRGTFVRPREDWHLLDADVLRWRFEHAPEPAFLSELYELRLITEPAIAGFAARRRSANDLVVLNAAVAQMRTTFPSDAPEHIEADVRFHRALFTAAHNELFEQIATVVEVALRVRDSFVHAHAADDPSDRHQDVVDAVAAGDPVAAETAVRDLLETAWTDVQRVLRTRGDTT